jgi:quinol monooxygenase YgiN
MYCRMVIGEAISPEQIQIVRSTFMEDIRSKITAEHGSLGSTFMVEEGGNLMVMMTHWTDRESCQRYHAGFTYRRFVQKTQEFLIGSLVVKSFVGIETADELTRRALHSVGLGHLEDEVLANQALIEADLAARRAVKSEEPERQTIDPPESAE